MNDEYQKMDSSHLTVCPGCKSDQYHRVPCMPHTDLVEYRAPIEMFSVACSDDAEIRELRRKVPDVEISADPRDPNYGVPIARTRHAKMAVLKASGFQEKN